MRSFWRPLSGEAKEPASSVEQPAASSAPSSVEQLAETFTSIKALKRWLDAQGEASSAPDLQRLRAAVLVLTKTPQPRREDVSPLCSAWKVHQKDRRKQRRPHATVISELQQAVIAEGNRLRNSLGAQTGASASSAARPADPPPASGAASSAEQLAVTSTAAERAVKRPMEAASAAQLDRRAKAPRKRASSASASAALIEALQTTDDDAGEASHPPRPHDDTSAAQPGPKSKQRRLTAMFPAADSQQAGAATSSGPTSPGFSEVNTSAARPGPPTKQQRHAAIPAVISNLQGGVDTSASAAQPGAAAATTTAAAASASPSSSFAERPEPLQHSILEYGSRPDDLAELRRAMVHIVKELTRLKSQTAADDDQTETLTKLHAQAKQLQQIPASTRTLCNLEISILYVAQCGRLLLKKQPYRDQRRDHKTVTAIACRALVSAVQAYLSARVPLNEERFPFLTKLHGATTTTQHQPPRTVQELHARLNEGEMLPTAPFGRHDPSEQLFNSHAWYSLTMLAALELPDVPFHVLLSNHTATALQDVITQRRTSFAQAASEQRHSIPSVAEVCQVLQQFYDDPYAQHLKQDWLVKALKIPEARRHDADYLAELFNTATEDFFLHAQQHGITATPLTKHTLATCTLFHLLLTLQKPPKALVLRFGPTLRLLANFKGECVKQYKPQDKCGADVELAANRLPAYFTRLADSAAQPVSPSSSAAQPAVAQTSCFPWLHHR